MLQVGLRVDAPSAVVVPKTRPPHVQGVQVARRSPAEAAERALQGVPERFSELSVEVGVDEGIEGGVEVAYPEHRDHHDVWVLNAEHGVGNVPVHILV